MRGRLAALLCLLLDAGTPVGDPARGRLLYERGVDEAGAPAAILELGAGGQTATSDRFPCASCHGEHGRGGREAGQELPSVRGEALARPGRRGRRAAYTPETLARAVRTGLDADGEPLSPVMPRYRLSRREAADLAAWLWRMGDAAAPGVADDAVTVGTVLPLGTDDGRAAATLLDAFVARWNETGGFYGRRVRLEVVDASTPAGARSAVDRLAGRALFLFGPAGPGATGEALAAATAAGLPVIGPAAPAPAVPGDAPTFWFIPAVDDGAARVAEEAVRALDGTPCRLSVTGGPDAWLDAFVARAEARGCVRGAPATLAVVQDVAPAPAITRAEAEGAHPLWLVGPRGVAGLDALPADVVARLRVAPAVGLPDPARPEARAIAGWSARLGLPAATGSAQAQAWVAALLAQEALVRAGRDLDRAAVVRALEDVRALETGVTPPIGFGPGRHVGVAAPAPVWLAGR